jgi:hypothetical protein
MAGASSMLLMTFLLLPWACRLSRSRHDQPGEVLVGHVQVEPANRHGAVRVLFRFPLGSDHGRVPTGHRRVDADLGITPGAGPSRRGKSLAIPWPAGQERSGQLLTTRAIKPDRNPPGAAATLIRTARPGRARGCGPSPGRAMVMILSYCLGQSDCALSGE